MSTPTDPLTMARILSRCDLPNPELLEFFAKHPRETVLLTQWVDHLDVRFPTMAQSRYRLDWDPSDHEIYLEMRGTGHAEQDVDQLWNLEIPTAPDSPWTIIPLLR